MARRTLEVVVAGDTKGLAKASRDADRHLAKIDKSAKRTSSGLKRSGSDVRGFASVTSGGFSRIGAAASGAGVLVAGAIGVMTKQIVSSASDIEESLTKNQALFGRYAEDVDKFSKTTAESFGISRAAALAAAGTFGGLFETIGIGDKPAAQMSTRLVKLASDLASFNNASPEEALEALRSGLSGEAEPLRRFNAFLSEGRVKAEAYASGIAESGATLTEAQKIQARYNLVLKDTKSAHGDFEKTSKGLANQQRILKARLTDLGSTLGKVLLPAVNTVAKKFNDFLTDVSQGKGVGGDFADGITSAFNTAKDSIDDLVDSFKGFKASRGGVGEALGATFAEAFEKIDWTDIAGKMGEGIKKALDLSGDLVGGIEDGIRAAVSNVNGEEVLSGLLRIFAEAINALFSPSFWKENFANIFATVTIVIPVAKILKIPGANALYNFISKPFFSALRRLGGAITGLLGRAATSGVGRFVDEIAGSFPGVVSVFVRLVSRIGGAMSGLPGRLRRTGAAAMTSLADSIGDRVGKIAADVVKFGVRIGKSLIDGIVKGVKSTAGRITGAITGGIGSIASKINPFGEGIGKEAGKAFGSMPRGGSISGSLKGADAGMRPFAVVGSRFGLGVSSGLRPGAVTSSQNRSWHASGEALDLSGPAAGMMRTFQFLKSRMGGRLAELIYTPGGVGIKNGRPHQYTGSVAADHYDHVHVAMDLGKPGQGDGTGRGDGPGRSREEQVFRFFKSKGFSDAQAAAWVGNLKQESGLSTTIVNKSSGATGLAQWLGSRLTGLKRQRNWTSLSTQLNYIWKELQGSESAAYRSIKAAKGLTPATSAIAFKFERMGAHEAAMGTRVAGARSAYRRFKGRGGAGTSTGRGRTGAARQAEERVSAYDAALAPADIAIAEAEARPGAEERGSATAARLSWALRDKRMIVGKRIRKIRRALKKKGLKPATRLRLQQELGTLIGEHASLGVRAKELAFPEAVEREELEAPDLPTQLDFLNRDISVAGLTAGTEDDIAAATALRDFRAQQYAFSRGGDPRAEGEFAEALKSAEDALKQLTDTTQEQTDAMKAHTEALDGVKAEIKRQTDFAAAVQTTESFQLKKLFADVMSGELGARGVGRAFTPGAGREFAW